MSTKRPLLSRRNVLRGMLGGAGVAIGLPVFDHMLGDNGDAYADGAPLLTRFGLWSFGNGVRLDSWIPTTLGADWQAPAGHELEALLPHKEYVSVVSGLSVKTPRHAHHSGMSAVFSGGPHLKVADVRDTIVSTFKNPSIDQIAATHYMNETPTAYRSLEAAITRFRGTDEGTSFQHLSHNGPNDVNPSEESPQAMFARLFGAGPLDAQIVAARVSVLDAVADQLTGLKNSARMGATDKNRLDAHLTRIRELEQGLTLPAGECTTPLDPGEFPDLEGNEQIEQKNLIMSQLVALALACGLTRSFSIMFSTCGSGVIMWPVGLTEGQHYLNHTMTAPYEGLHQAVRFTMGQLAVFLQTLRDTTEGDKNLLDLSSILVATEHTEGWTHSQDDMPILVCGKGNGKLRGNVHARIEGGNTTMALLSALRGGGLPLTEFGYEEGFVNQSVTEIESA
jgi:hypothetical protein